MQNKVELKKLLKQCLVLMGIILILFLFITIREYRNYTINFNNKIASIVNVLQKEYPKITEEEIINILNNKESLDKSILKKYGISLDNKAIVIKNDDLYYQYLILKIGLLVSSFILLIGIFLKYLRKRDLNIQEITQYIEQLNQKNYSLKIDSNSEDELSILKNEIYKVTVMLKETTEIALKDKNNLKESLEDISHQLKTPLTSILVMLDNLIDNPDMDLQTKEDFIWDIKRNITNINFLVQTLLKLAKFDANTISFNQEAILIKNILEEAYRNVSPLCDLKNIKVNIKGDAEARIICDFRWEVEALTNIIKNCIEYSSYGEKIDVYYEQNKAYSLITIKDYGKGIREEDLKHIFNRFYQGQNSRPDSIGIGLALAKTIIEKDQGIIRATSDYTGTKFTIKYFNL